MIKWYLHKNGRGITEQNRRYGNILRLIQLFDPWQRNQNKCWRKDSVFNKWCWENWLFVITFWNAALSVKVVDSCCPSGPSSNASFPERPIQMTLARVVFFLPSLLLILVFTALCTNYFLYLSLPGE